MNPLYRDVLPGGAHGSLVLRRGRLLRLTDVEGGANLAFWCNEDFSKLLKDAKITADPAERTALYEQAQVIFKDQAPWFTIAHSTQYVPMSNKVSGFVMSPLGDFTFETVDIAE